MRELQRDFQSYLNQIYNGKEIYIDNHEFIDDSCGSTDNPSGWQTESWSKVGENYICHYPISTYPKDFYTIHTRQEFFNAMAQTLYNQKRYNSDIEIIIKESDNNLTSKKIAINYVLEYADIIFSEKYPLDKDNLEEIKESIKILLENKIKGESIYEKLDRNHSTKIIT